MSAPAVAQTSLVRMRQLALFVLALVVWLASFSLLLRLGTWLQFAFAGLALATLTLALDADTRGLLRPGWRDVALGLGSGLLMVLLTHAAFDLVARHAPEVRATTARLFRLMNIAGFPAAARTCLIVVIASCEEVIFRGAQLGPTERRAGRFLHPIRSGDALRIAAYSATYAAAMVTAGSALLVACAFACGVVWAALRVTTRSLVSPIVAHVVWDLGVLIAWPLVERSA